MATVAEIQGMIVAEANAQGVPAALALAVAAWESGFDQSKVGSAGDTGVFQIIPSTAQILGVDASDLGQNIHGGVEFLSDNLRQFGGDPTLALEAYNAGPDTVQAALNSGQAPPSASYAASVLKLVPGYQKLVSSLSTGPGAAPGATPPASSSLPIALWAGLGAIGIGVLVLLVGAD